jgi:hypothetical protein
MTDERKQGPIRWAGRFLAGRPIKGHLGHPYRRPGRGRLAGWERQVWRLGVCGYAYLLFDAPRLALWLAGFVVAVLVSGGRRLVGRSRFHREYIAPTLAAMAPALGLDDGQVDLHVDPSLGTLTPRLAKPLSPTERSWRLFYGRRIEPAVRFLPERAQRAAWTLQRWARPVTAKAELLRRPTEDAGPRIELVAKTPYLTAEQRMLISSIINSKIPVADLVESWHQVGPKVRARWIVRRRPPAQVDIIDVEAHIDRLKEWEFYIGEAAGGQSVIISLKDDSPHIAVSAGSGAGKSVLAQLIAVQVLRRGGRVVILDRKGSHRWAIGLAGVDYCTKPEQMHRALIREAAEADERNDAALYEEEDWDPGPRTLIICEELNATIGQLTNHWADVREKSDPKKSPAIAALAELLFMGRAAKKNVLAIAQMLTARAIGGPEARENFGIRFLARYTKNAWKMLVPEAALARVSRTIGRWQVVIGGVATEVQVAYLTAKQARALAKPGDGLDNGLARDVTDDGDMMTLQAAVDEGLIPWKYAAAKQRMSRKVGAVPKPQGQKGKAFLYSRTDLIRWRESAADKEMVS